MPRISVVGMATAKEASSKSQCRLVVHRIFPGTYVNCLALLPSWGIILSNINGTSFNSDRGFSLSLGEMCYIYKFKLKSMRKLYNSNSDQNVPRLKFSFKSL